MLWRRKKTKKLTHKSLATDTYRLSVWNEEISDLFFALPVDERERKFDVLVF